MIVLILMSGIGFTAPAVPENRLNDIHLNVSDKGALLSFELSAKPGIIIGTEDDRGLGITVKNLIRPDKLIQKIKGMPQLSMHNEKGTGDIRFNLDAQKFFNRVDCSWIKEKNTFNINLTLIPDEKVDNVPDKRASEINDIRFGFKDKSARVVIGTDKKPAWHIEFGINSSALLSLESSPEKIKHREFTPDKWVEHISIKEAESTKSNIAINMKSEPGQVSIFWMKTGKRLVMDLKNSPEESITGSPVKDSGESASDKNRDKLAIRVDEKEEGKFNTKVRMKIVKNLLSTEERKDEKQAATPVITEKPHIISPELKNIFPAIKETKIDIQKLGPEEAFLFGRIEQAREIHDYDMGITLSNQFLTEFGQSKLFEVVSFWRGDFYFSQWEMGATDLSEKVINAYQYAIDKFTDSDNALLAYMKMALVSSHMENGFNALGYLGIVVSKKDSRFMPLAYLTRGKVFLQINQPEEAIKDFKILLEEFPDTKYAMEANLWIAGYYHEMGLYEKAEAKLDEIDLKYPELYVEYPEFILLNAKNNLYLNNYEKAREYLFKAVNLGSQQEGVDLLLSRIGDTYHNEENKTEAEKYYRMVVDYYPDSEGASIAKLRLADYFSDITILEDLSEENENEPIGDLAVLRKGYQLYENRRYSDAIATLEELVSKPVQTETRKDAKRLYVSSVEKELSRLWDQGLNRELTDLYNENRFMLQGKIKPEVLLLAGNAYSELDLDKDAVSVYSGIKPYDLDVKLRGEFIYSLASSQVKMDYLDEAMSLLEKSRDDELEPGHIQKLDLLLADIYRQKGRNIDAERLYEKVVTNIGELPPDEAARAYLNLGSILKKRDQYKAARSALNTSIDISLKNDEDKKTLNLAYMELGDISYREGKYNQSAKAFEKGFSMGYGAENADYWESRFKQAVAYIKVGEGTKAESLLTDITEGSEGLLQQKAQIKLGALVLEKQLKTLSLGEN